MHAEFRLTLIRSGTETWFRQSDGSWRFTRDDGYYDGPSVACSGDDTGKYMTIDTPADAHAHHANYRKGTFSNGAYRGTCDDDDSGIGIVSSDNWTATPQVADGWTASRQG
ncbi:MAG: hypothetical protein WB579_07225 [Bryobacteraceae bacterium]